MSAEQWEALHAESQQDQELRQALAEATSAEQVVTIAAQRGFDIDTNDLPTPKPGSGELSEADLESVSGGTISTLFTFADMCI